jgi:hypothetical protein
MITMPHGMRSIVSLYRESEKDLDSLNKDEEGLGVGKELGKMGNMGRWEIT